MRRLPLLVVLLVIALPARADEDAGTALLESGAVFVEARVEPQEGAVVGQRVSLQLDLGTANWFTGAPTLPDPEIEGAIVRRFGNQAVNASETRNGKAYAVQSWTWWVYPRRAGTFEVSALEVVLRTIDDERNKVEVRARTKPLRFEAKPPPGAADGDMLATRRFVLEQTLDPEPEALKVGDALRRTLTMRADDVPGMLVPPVPLETPDGLHAYPDAPRVEDEYDRGSLTGLRVQSSSYVLERDGEYIIPEVQLRWWNLDTRVWEAAVAEAVAFTVAPNPDAVLGSPTEDDAGDVGRAERGVSARRIVGTLVVLLLLALVAVFVARRLPSWKQALAAARRKRRESEPRAFQRFAVACRTDDPVHTRDALRAWLDRAVGPGLTVEAFVAQADDEVLASEAGRLGARLYGSGPPRAWSGAGLSAAVAHARGQMWAGRRQAPTDRRPLNPRGGHTHR